jgi:transposase
MGLSDGVPNAPTEAPQELLDARRRAVNALLDAEKAEQVARRSRRKATARMKAYEHLLEEYRGQMRLEV